MGWILCETAEKTGEQITQSGEAIKMREREKRVVTIAWSDSLKKLFKNEYIHIGEAPSSSPSTSPCFGTQDALINLHDESIKMPIVKPLLAYMVYCTLLYAFLHPLHTYCLHICSFITLLQCRNNNNK